MNLDALLANFAGSVHGNRKETPYRGRQEAEAANGSQFDSLLSGFDTRNATAARAGVIDATDNADNRSDRRAGDEKPAADPPSNSAAALPLFVTEPTFDMSRSPSVIARQEPDLSHFESSSADNYVPSTAGQSESTRAESGAATARGFSSPTASTAPASYTLASDRRAVPDDGGTARSSVSEPQAAADSAAPPTTQSTLPSIDIGAPFVAIATAAPDATNDESMANARVDLVAKRHPSGASFADGEAPPAPKAPIARREPLLATIGARGRNAASDMTSSPPNRMFSNSEAFTSVTAMSRDGLISSEDAASASNAMAQRGIGVFLPSDVTRTSAISARPPTQRREIGATVSSFDGAMSSQKPEMGILAATLSDGASTTILPTEMEQSASTDVSEDAYSAFDAPFDPRIDAFAGHIAPARPKAPLDAASPPDIRASDSFPRADGDHASPAVVADAGDERRFASRGFDAAAADIAKPSAERRKIDVGVAPTSVYSPPVTEAAQIPEAASATATVADHSPTTQTRASFAKSGAPAPGSRASNELYSSGSEAAAPFDASTGVVAPASIAQVAGEEAFRGDRSSDRRVFVEDLRAQSMSAGRADSTMSPRAPETSFNERRDLQPALAATGAAASIDEISASDVAPQQIGTLAILAHDTRLPSAFAELLAPQARSLIASASPAVASTVASEIVDAQRRRVAPKVLTIEMAPASLGAITVKMKLAHSGIDMRISVETTEALQRLDSTRDQLVEAMQASGCVVDSCTIQIGQRADSANVQAAQDGGAAYAQSNGTGAGREEESVGRQGAGYGGQDSGRRQGAGGEAGEPTSKSEVRRVADARGNGVYL